MAEFEFINWLAAELKAKHSPNRALTVGLGDDMALLPPAPHGTLLAADMIMDGVHFDLKQAGPQLAGRKALAVNLSDIAAMAGTPTSVTVCLALPRNGGEQLAKEIMRGMLPLAEQFGVAIAGGDTNSWEGPLVISVTITGTPHEHGSVLRGGAKAGDWICVTGDLGGSITSKHLNFTPRINEAKTLHRQFGLTAMLDLSDGLGSDLRHILRASDTGAIIDKTMIPISAAAIDAAKQSPKTALDHALSDGEDFELCFTLPPAAGAALTYAQPFGPSLGVHKIGEITSTAGLYWEDGQPVNVTGWIHQMA
jgi:thiamine-monophosphate kinase